MFCSKCGNESLTTNLFCHNCGTAFNKVSSQTNFTLEAKNHHSNDYSKNAKSLPIPTLWNPSIAASLSLPFTFIFGAYLQMLNWRTLGYPEKAAASLKWFYAGLAVFILLPLLLVTGIIGNLEYTKAHAEQITNTPILSFPLTIAWYFLSGRKQICHIEEKLGKNYLKKSWHILFGAIGFSVLYGVFLAILVSILTTLSHKAEIPIREKSDTLNPSENSNPSPEQKPWEQFANTTPTHQFSPEVYQAYPDADAIVNSDEFKHWFNSQPPVITKGGIEKYSTTQRTGLMTALNMFKNKELCTQGQSFSDPETLHPDPNGKYTNINCVPNTWSYSK